MRALFADTFYFLALVNGRDHRHATAAQFDATQPSLVTTAWVLTEVGVALSAPENRPVFLGLLDLLRETPEVCIIPAADLFARGVELYRQRLDKESSLTDCISFVVMADRKISEALTGDHHFEQAGFRALLK
jgi:predicted nucleic acid-binding protein